MPGPLLTVYKDGFMFPKTKQIVLGLFLSASVLVAGACSHKPYLSNAKDAGAAYEECHKLSESDDYDKANECFEVLKSRFPSSEFSYLADIDVGDNYFRKGDYLPAAETYMAFAKLHPTHDKVGYAYYKTGLCYLRENPKSIDRDQKYLETSLQYFELALPRVSGDLKEAVREKWSEARLRIARRHFYIGRFYHRTGEYLAAIPRFQEIVTNYTGLGLDEKSLYLLGDSYVRLGQKERALDILSVFEQHFPQSKYRQKLSGRLSVK